MQALYRNSLLVNGRWIKSIFARMFRSTLLFIGLSVLLMTLWLQPSPAYAQDPVFVDSDQNMANAYTHAVALGDLDGDGDLDAFVGNVGAQEIEGNEVWFNDGRGIFRNSGQSLGRKQTFAVALGDVDGDGDLDAFVANAANTGNSGAANEVWLNNGRGSFTQSGQELGAGRSFAVALGDLDGDGDLDVLVGNGGANEVWLNDGGAQGGTPGNFSPSDQFLDKEARTESVVLGHLDGDRFLDALILNSSESEVWLNDGQGNFLEGAQTLENLGGLAVALGDLDGDDDLDIFVAKGGSCGICGVPNSVWLNQGGIQEGVAGVFGDSGQSLGDSNKPGRRFGRLGWGWRSGCFCSQWSRLA